MDTQVTLKVHESIKITTTSGESIRVIIREDVIEILGVDYKVFSLYDFYSNKLCLKLK